MHGPFVMGSWSSSVAVALVATACAAAHDGGAVEVTELIVAGQSNAPEAGAAAASALGVPPRDFARGGALLEHLPALPPSDVGFFWHGERHAQDPVFRADAYVGAAVRYLAPLSMVVVIVLAPSPGCARNVYVSWDEVRRAQIALVDALPSALRVDAQAHFDDCVHATSAERRRVGAAAAATIARAARRP